MADGAVLAHHVLVLEHDAGPRAIILGHIGAADEIDDLIGLDRAGARIHRIGSDAGEIVDLERRDGAIALDADLSLAAMVAGMNVGVEALDPVGDEFDRPPQQLRQRVGRHLVGIDVDLDAEGAADVLADHANLRFLQARDAAPRCSAPYAAPACPDRSSASPRRRSSRRRPSAAPASRRYAVRRRNRPPPPRRSRQRPDRRRRHRDCARKPDCRRARHESPALPDRARCACPLPHPVPHTRPRRVPRHPRPRRGWSPRWPRPLRPASTRDRSRWRFAARI